MTLEVAYWIALGVGVAFLVLAMVFGDVFDFLDFLDFDLGDGFAATPVLFTSIAAFGGGGLLALDAFEASPGVSIFGGLGTAVVLGGVAALFFRALGRQEAKETFATSQLIGERGTCTLAAGPGKAGRVAIHHAGMTRSFGATSAEPIAAGQEIIVLDVVGGTLKVGAVNASEETPA